MAVWLAPLGKLEVCALALTARLLDQDTDPSSGGISPDEEEDPDTRDYAEYFRDARPKLGFFGSAGKAKEVGLSNSAQAPNAIKIAYDSKSGDYLVVDVSFSGKLGYRIVRPDGSQLVKYSSQGSDYSSFSIASLPALGEHRFVLCATKKDQILCRIITDTGVFSPDWVSPIKGVDNWDPLIAVPALLPYIAWIQDNLLLFGHPEERP